LVSWFLLLYDVRTQIRRRILSDVWTLAALMLTSPSPAFGPAPELAKSSRDQFCLLTRIKVKINLMAVLLPLEPICVWSALTRKSHDKWGTVDQVCNPSYSGCGDQEDHSSRSAQAKSSKDSISTSGWV
jgi:hypothetical protein